MAEDKKKEIDVTVIEVTEEYLKEKLYKIRGKRVLLDADLAEIYGYDTKGFNRQVKNNIEKFDEDFMFELTDEELEDLRYKNCTANISSKSRYNPHVFTEQGLYMLITSIVEDYGISKYAPVIATLLKNPTLILPQQRGVNVLKKKTKCYIYTRVSTVIQVDGYSLDAQKDKLKKYAEFQDMMLQNLESELIN